MSIENRHILVIDDNEDILFMLEAMLQIKGYRVSIKKNLENLEVSLKQLSPDVILMDMFLPGGNGREICKSLKANFSFSNIPVIIISANSCAEAECLEAGADYFIEKPFEMKVLYKAVTQVLS